MDKFEIALKGAEVSYKFDCFDKSGEFCRFIASHGAEKIYNFKQLQRAIKNGDATYSNGVLQWKLKRADFTKAVF